MKNDLERIRAVVRAARRRWFWHTAYGAVARALLSVAVVLLAGWAAVRLGHLQTADALIAVGAAVAVGICAAVAWAAWPLRHRPSDGQVARFIEERCPNIDDRLVTAVECATGQAPQASASPLLVDLLYRDAARRVADLDLDQTITRAAVRRAALLAGASAAVLLAVLVLSAPDVGRSIRAMAHYAFPPTVTVQVLPGDARIPAGTAFRVTARVAPAPNAPLPVVTIRDRRGASQHAMRQINPGVFEYTLPAANEDFTYGVTARSAVSGTFTVKVFHPARVSRIDVRYEYPPALKMPPRTEQDSGDVYAPEGTRVHFQVYTDKPVASGLLKLADGSEVQLSSLGTAGVRPGQPSKMMGGALTVSEDSSYRVALTDGDGLKNPGETEYFIRVLTDAPPDVRIVQPAADRQVTPLEEVTIGARAEDDHGVRDFDLVYSVRGGPERRLPFATRGTPQALDGTRVLFLEDLHVQPGDFVTYYARARDKSSGGTSSSEARSDIFFLQVTRFDEEFVPPQSQAASGGANMGRGAGSLEELIRAQKEVIVATWKLDRRARRSHASGSEDDVRTIARAQGDLRKRAMQAAGASSLTASGESSAAVPPPDARKGQPDADPMTNAIDAMRQAEQSLDAVKTSEALPHETRALNELMKAEASQRRRQLMQARNGAGSDGGNANQDLSSVFDRELQRQQKTNYEMPRTNSGSEDHKSSEALERLHQLAERQGDLSQRQRDLERDRQQMSADEFKRQLERLTREQSDLRQQVEQLAQQMKSGQAGASGRESGDKRPGGQGQQSSSANRMREASEAMRDAAARLRDGKVGEAGKQGEQALGKLRSAEQEMRGQPRAGGGSSLGDLQMQARELADAQRQVAQKAGQAAGAGKDNADTWRRIAGEKERLADQSEHLQKAVKRATADPSLDGQQRQALEGVGRDLDRLQLPEQMRRSAAAMRDPSKGDVNRPESAAKEEEVARTLGRLADRLSAASGPGGSKQAADQLQRTRSIKDRLAQLERRMKDAERQGATDKGAGSQSTQAKSAKPDGTVGTSGRGTAQGQASTLEQLREEYRRELQRAAEHLNGMRGQTAGIGFTPEGQGAIHSAPGFHQDFSRWEQLSHGINAGLERAETALSKQLRGEQSRDRLQAPAAERAPESYRRLVEQYYQSLAGKPSGRSVKSTSKPAAAESPVRPPGK